MILNFEAAVPDSDIGPGSIATSYSTIGIWGLVIENYILGEISNIRGLMVIPKTDFICWSKSKISVGGLLLGALRSKWFALQVVCAPSVVTSLYQELHS